MKPVFYLMISLLPLSGAAQTNNAEWLRMKQDCGLPASLAYNDWVKQNMPCYKGNNNNSQPSGPTAAEIAARQAEDARNQRITEASNLNDQGIEAYNAGDYQTAIRDFQDALDKMPDDATIKANLQKAKDQVAYLAAAKKQMEEEAFNKNKTETLNQLKGISDSGTFDARLRDAPNSGSGALNLKTLPDANTDTRVVDARNVPSGLPRSVDDAILSGYAAAPPGVSDRVRKGFQAIAAHDWILAKAWFGDALNHDPNNQGLKRLVELADYTRRSLEQQKAAKISEASLKKITLLPQDSDMRFLFPGDESPASRKHLQLPQDSDMRFLFPDDAAPASGKKHLDLPKDSDIEFLFPGLAPPDARKMNDYIIGEAIKKTETDPQLIKISQPANSNQSSNPYELK